MTTFNKRNDGSINPCFLESVIDETRTTAYLMNCIGDSATASGMPTDMTVFNQTMYQLSSKLDGIADALEVACDDLKEEQSRDTIQIAVKHVGSEPVIKESVVTLDTLQETVRGYMGINILTYKLAVVFNQLGRYEEGLKHNCDIGKTNYYGTIIFIGMDENGRFTSITEDQLEYIKELM